MAASTQAIWMVLLSGSILLYAQLARARGTRLDERATIVTGLIGLACVITASVYASAG